jgi:type I restriction enzyme S subunit
MKDSGVPWLGKVPEHWRVLPNRAIFDEVKERDRPDADMLSVTITKGVIRQQALLEDSSKKDSSNQDKFAYKLVRPGDIAYNKMRAWQGAVGVSEHEGIVSPAYVVQRPHAGAAPRYLHYLLRTPAFAKEAERWSYGITSDMWSLRPEHFRLIYSCLPPLAEQAAIVRFLDHADRRIRRYIRAKQKLIKLLEEQKQAIIHRAVTRGLDPNVRLKPSGVKWLGDVPEHWLLKKLRQCGSIVGGMTPSMADPSLWNGHVPWVTPKDMKRFAIDGASMNVSARALEVTSLRLIPPGSVLLVVRGMILARRVPIARTTQPVTINQDMKAIVPDGGIDAGYLTYRMDAAQAVFVPMIDEAGHGTKRFPTERWRDIVFAIPPATEQRLIVRHLDGATENLAKNLSVNSYTTPPSRPVRGIGAKPW